MLETINETHWIVDVLLLNRKVLLIVEPRLFRRGIYSNDLKLEDMEVIKVKNDLSRPQSNIVAVSHYWDSLLDKNFIFMLKDSGVLEILDGDLRTIDHLDTGIELSFGPKTLVADETSGHVVVQLTSNAIHFVATRRSGETIGFIRDGGYPKCIYQAPGEIISFELAWHFDQKSNGDFATIATLIQTNVQSGISFEVIRQTQKSLRGKKNEWESLIELTRLDILGHASFACQGYLGRAALKTVPNVGFFIFALGSSIFFQVTCDSRHSINDAVVTDSFIFNGLESGLLDENEQTSLNLQSTVLLKQDGRGLDFTIFTNSLKVFRFKLRLLFEHPEEYVYEWSEPSIESSSILMNRCQKDFKEEFMSNLSVINASTILMWTRKTGIAFIDVATMSQSQSLSFSQPSTLYSGRVGYDFFKLVSCCGFDGSEGTIQTLSYGFEDFLVHRADIANSEDKAVGAWLTKDGLWWKTEDGSLRNGSMERELGSTVMYVTWAGEKITEPVLAATAIWNDKEGNFASLDSEGVVRWSPNDGLAKVMSGKIPLDAQINLACLKKNNGSVLTVISVGDKLILLTDEKLTLAKDIQPAGKRLSICSFFIVCGQDHHHVLIGTNSGKIHLFNLHTFEIEETLRLGSKKIRFCGVPESNHVFAYSDDDLLLIQINPKGKYKITKVHVTFRIDLMSARSINEIYIFEKGGLVSRYEMPLEMKRPIEVSKSLAVPSHCPTKFISFACSNRLIVASSMRTTCSPERSHYSYSSFLLLFDVESHKQSFLYDLSEKFPQAIVSDILAIPYEVPHANGTPLLKELSFAKRLTLSRCFLVSLNYESAENDNLDNLLLFSIDENKCTLDLHCGFKIGSTITALGNYHANMFIVAGETLQIFEIDYLLQENAFRFSQASNPTPISGFSTKVVGELPGITRPGLGVELQTPERIEKILVVDALEGLQEYSVSSKNTTILKSSESSSGNRLDPVPSPQKVLSFVVSSAGSKRLVIDCAWVLFEGVFWIVVAFTDCCLEIYCIEETDEESDIKQKMVGIDLDCQITGVTTILWSDQEKLIGKVDRAPKFSLSKTRGNRLFCISTARGGVYALEDTHLRLWIDS